MSYEIKSPDHHHQAGRGLFDEIFTKEAYVTGASAPILVDSEHAGIPYSTRRKAYLRYVDRKSREGRTNMGEAMLTGTVLGAGLGSLMGAPAGAPGLAAGAVVGGLSGGIIGAAAKVSDDAEINAARRAVRGGNAVVDEMLAHRMAHRHAMEREQDRAERRAQTYAITRAVNRPRTVNNYNTRVNAINMRNSSYTRF